VRSGSTMEQALCDICKDVSLGKILIQTNVDTGCPEASINIPLFHDILIAPISSIVSGVS